jgi:hypothetical protein
MSVAHTDTEVPANCIVKVNTTTGKCLISVAIGAPCDLIVVSLALVIVIAKRISAPRMSLHLVWPVLPASGADTTMVDVQCIVSPMSEHRWWLDEPEVDEEDGVVECDVCQDPCPDADRRDAPRSRKENCVRCEPCCLCALCRVQKVDGDWYCFDCIGAGDKFVWNAPNVRRAHLVGVGYKTATAAMPVAAI